MLFSIDDPFKPRYASRAKSFRPLEDLSSSHWRARASKKFIDYSKRNIRNPYCIHPENCVNEPRKRRKVCYNENAYWSAVMTGKEIKADSASSRSRKNQSSKAPPLKKMKVEKISQNDLVPKKNQEALSEVSQKQKSSDVLDVEVIKQIERLGGILPSEISPRIYINYTTCMPAAIQAFCDIKWDHACFDSIYYRIEVEFSGEFALDRSEIADVPLLHKNGFKSDYILIGDGTTLIVARNNDHSSNPTVYLASNIGSDFELYNKPIKLSEFLKTLEVDRSKSPSMFTTDE